eukprot:TRINITY_DN27489_c0_g1_i2.p1 TRINITY_DN27489_c0_g1~~TRINITY_DN27489_c0_g1_i2.p1  ORF type:complete len:322 (-),score=25.63 TRINITY_DN27489_c0_g1_i2:189-1154(-)
MGSLRPLAVAFVLLSLHAVLCTAQAGSWTAIPDAANNTDVFRVADFAVSSYATEQTTDLRLASVVSAESQVVAGTNYNVTVVAVNMTDSVKPTAAEYIAVVYDSLDSNLTITTFAVIPGTQRDATADEIATVQAMETSVGPGVPSVPSPTPSPATGGWTPVPDAATNKDVLRAAEFAVSESNKLQGSNFTLTSVDAAETQIVKGVNYNITLSAWDGPTGAQFIAIVNEVPWENTFNLTSWTVIPGSTIKAGGTMAPSPDGSSSNGNTAANTTTTAIPTSAGSSSNNTKGSTTTQAGARAALVSMSAAWVVTVGAMVVATMA